MGSIGRQTVVADWSVHNMVYHYERLITTIFARKTGGESRQSISEDPPLVSALPVPERAPVGVS
jgi:hypothetical protein